MNEYLIYGLHKNISDLLGKRKLKHALDEISNYIKETPEWSLHTDYEDIQTAYRYMLQYFRQNIDDPQRAKLYNDLIRKSYVLNDRIMVSLNQIISTEYYYICLREQKKNPNTLSEYQLMLESFTEDTAVTQLLHEGEKREEKMRELRIRHEQACTELFKKVWTSTMWDSDTIQSAQNLLSSVMVQPNDLALFISAVTLGALQIFDIQKYLFLMDAYNHSEPLVSQRALVGVILLSIYNPKRLDNEPEVKARFSLLNENPDFLRNITDIQIQLLRTRETQKVDKKMREEIIPEVMKKTDLMRNAKLGLEELEDDLLSNDKNPDWKEWKDESDLSNKLKELGDMQLEGVDVYMSTFSQLKTFPFFREIGNWFYPFDPYHSAVIQSVPEIERKNNFMIQSILNTTFFCNSDKYSFCFTMERVPAAQRNLYTADLSEQNMQDFKAGLPIQEAEQKRQDVISRQYIQDLYRFYKIYPRRHEFKDIFDNSLNLFYCPVLKESISSPEQQAKITEYLFQKGYYPEAAIQFKQLIQQGKEDAEIYQKLGFCYQKTKNYHKAVEAYIQADIRQADNVWTNRHLAQCYRLLKETDKALSYYEKVEAVQPEDLTLLLYIGQCYAELKRYDEAFARFFKVEYLDPQSLKAQRAIAWCSFVTNKMEQAEKYYEKLLSQPKPQELDFLNAGHVAWSLKNIDKAARLYIQGSRMQENPETFIEQILKDEEELIRHGISKEDIPLMLDIIRYQRDEEE